LRTTVVGDVVLSWDDVLHVGPLAFEPAESRPLRAAFLAEHGWGEAAAIDAELRRRDELLAGATRVVLWFEHDLVDQLQLLQVLSQVGETADVELVQADDYLGSLDGEALGRLRAESRRLDAATIALARDAWRAVCGGAIRPFIACDTSSLPFLRPALHRLVEERGLLPRTKRQLLRALLDGPRRPLELFVANQALEEAIFLGDTWCFLFLHELARDGLVTPVGGGELPLPPPRGDYSGFVATLLELTPAGRELV